MKTLLLLTSLLKLLHQVTPGCILHTYIDSRSSIDCDNLFDNFENIKPLKSELVVTVNITQSNITKISSGSFDDFRQLRKISLSGNVIEEIEFGAFSAETFRTQLPFLRILDLSENNIETLPKEIFNHSSTLELNLSSNALKQIEHGAFLNMHGLKKLDLSYNLISSDDEENVLPLGIFQDISTLEKLNLSHNSLKSIKIGTFSLLPYLFHLDLSHNELTHLTSGVFVGTVIQDLFINDNKLVVFEFPNARNVHPTINLANNDFECDSLAMTMSKIHNAFFTRGEIINEPNIFGISCRDNNEIDEDEEEEDNKDFLYDLAMMKYLSIGTLCVSLILMCYLVFCQKNNHDDECN
ncbi:carboxypeptidase N subunit 2-like [Onthophagus taurus]|uniref:carboxypeptidase N subunit 2-like n=1 Tax=Onthophagus taurus TaxID=166361 RepID=UPI0039BE7671